MNHVYIVRDADERKSLIMRKKKDHGIRGPQNVDMKRGNLLPLFMLYTFIPVLPGTVT